MSIWHIVGVALAIWLVGGLVVAVTIAVRVMQGMREKDLEHERMKAEFEREWNRWGRSADKSVCYSNGTMRGRRNEMP